MEVREPIDLMVTGSPCDPFSVQRAKRFQMGDVKNHAAYSVTMSSVISMYEKYEPYVGVVEQVMGFLYPLDTTTDRTPYDRPGVWSTSLANCLLGAW